MKKFERTREDHQKEIAEDYLEKINELIQEKGEARAVDLAYYFGVSAVNISKILQRLQKEDLIQSLPYRSIFLTDKGRIIANQAQERHRIVKEFLKKIGVPEEVAQIDSEGIEHHVSSTTLEKMKMLIDK